MNLGNAKRALTAALTLALVLLQPTVLPAAAEGSLAGAPPIKIGIVMSLTGVGSKASKDMVNAFKLYFDQINNTVDGRKVEILVEDDQERPSIAIDKLTKLINQDHIDIFAGIRQTPIAYQVSKLVDTQFKIPFILMLAASNDLTQRKHPRWLLRTWFASGQLLYPFGEYAAKKLHYKRIATVAVDNSYGYEGVGSFQTTFEKAGGQIVQKVWLPFDAKDFKTQLSSISKDADAVFLMTMGRINEIVAKEIKELGITKPILSQGGISDETEFAKLGDDVVGYITVLPYSGTITTAANKNFIKAYQEKYGQVPGYFAESAYTTAMLIHKALDSLKGDVSNKEQLLSALQHTQLSDAPSGAKKFDTYGQVVQNIYIRQVEKQNGAYQNKVLQTFPAVSQFWTLKPEQYLKEPPYSKNYPPCQHCAP